MGKLSFVLFIVILLQLSGCGELQRKVDYGDGTNDSVSKSDIGFTGVKPYYQDERLLKEVTFRNGVRNGVTKSYYPGGQLRQEIFYSDGLKSDTAKWYYTEGPLYRSTPYLNDSINGTQIQYFRDGSVKAKMSYSASRPYADLREYHTGGRLVTDYPVINQRVIDNYSVDGSVTILLDLTSGSKGIRWFRGSLNNNLFVVEECKELPVSQGSGILQLEKSESIEDNSVTVIAIFPTAYANAKYITKVITLPYRNLKHK